MKHKEKTTRTKTMKTLEFTKKQAEEYMIKQTTDTIDGDCDTKYYNEGIERIELELRSLDAKIIREKMVAKAKRDLEYYTKEYNEDVKRCEQSNKWVKELLNSIEK